jgi:hypothetical protein
MFSLNFSSVWWARAVEHPERLMRYVWGGLLATFLVLAVFRLSPVIFCDRACRLSGRDVLVPPGMRPGSGWPLGARQ